VKGKGSPIKISILLPNPLPLDPNVMSFATLMELEVLYCWMIFVYWC
jgi:hypothetical protein